MPESSESASAGLRPLQYSSSPYWAAPPNLPSKINQSNQKFCCQPIRRQQLDDVTEWMHQ